MERGLLLYRMNTSMGELFGGDGFLVPIKPCFMTKKTGRGTRPLQTAVNKERSAGVPWSEELPDRERKRNSFLKKFAIDTKIFILHF